MKSLLMTCALLLMFFLARTSHGYPGFGSRRHKRLSDQRRAELETLMALSKMSGKLMNYSHSARHVDPAKIGRRRRSIAVQNPQKQELILRHRGVSINEGGASYPLIS